MPSESFVPLPGSQRQPLPGVESVGSPDESRRIEITVITRRRAELPSGSVTGAVVSQDELAQLYGTDPADAAVVRDTLSRFGLEVTQMDPGRRRLKATGTVRALSQAFGTSLSVVRSAHPSETGPTEHLYRLGALHIPAELDGIIVSVLGLDDRPQARPHVRLASATGDQTAFTPNQVAGIYRFPAGMTGAGQTIAFIELGGGFSASDIQSYFTSLGIAIPVVTAVGVDGMVNAPRPDSWAGRQALLDIEVAGAVSPGATQVVYFAPNTDRGIVDAVMEAVHATPTPTALCIGWGQSESTWTSQAMSALDLALQDAAALGVTVCVAAGDDGSTDGQTDGQNHVVFPASSPNCLACGGTSLQADPAGTIISETVWNNGADEGAGGGGISERFGLPEWQAGVVPSSTGSPGRGVPDVAGNADPTTGYRLLIDGKPVIAGGTGAVASLWAALICRLAEASGQPLGPIQPTLYAGATAGATAPGFRDITSGSNGAYSAGPGWDACTGLGVWEGEELLSRLTSSASLEAGYDSDDIGSIDLLGISEDVNVLAALISSSHTLPPLSIGLFGDWGTGKSFFMRRLEDRVTILASAARAARSETPPRPSFYCRYIAQITFNAWHYVEADLWASLAAHVFEGLSKHLQAMQPGQASDKAYRNMISQLESSQAALTDARERLKTAKASLSRAEERRDTHLGERDSLTLAGLANRQPELKDDVDRLSSALGREQVKVSVRDIQNFSEGPGQTRGLLRRSWQALGQYRQGRARRKLLLALAGFFGVLAVLLLAWFLARNKPLAATVASAVALLSGAVTTLTVLLAGTRKVMSAADMIVQAKDRRDQETVSALEREVEEAGENVRRLTEEVAKVQEREFPTLDSLIRERASSSDYRQHLGLVALIQRDFQALSELLTARTHRPASGKAPKGPLPSVDRIVLYIDDLDRCPPDKVVQVLQAIHLLLAFPLFVVVVGVDSRWLVRSLENEYNAILSPDKPAENHLGQASELTSAPHNYLEKIFQIPFWLRPMAPDGYGRLIRTLASASAPTETNTQDTHADTEPSATGTHPSTPTSEQNESQADPAGQSTAPEPEPSGTPIDLTPSALIISDYELAYAEKLSALIPTPRAAKRFINLYRLLKVGLSDEDAVSLSGDNSTPGEYQAALLLLAIMIGAPTEADTIFRTIRGRGLDSWAAVVAELRPQPWDDPGATDHYSHAAGQLSASDAARWHRLCQILDQIGTPATAEGLVPFRSWADRIGRYSFSAGWAAGSHDQVTDETKSPRSALGTGDGHSRSLGCPAPCR